MASLYGVIGDLYNYQTKINARYCGYTKRKILLFVWVYEANFSYRYHSTSYTAKIPIALTYQQIRNFAPVNSYHTIYIDLANPERAIINKGINIKMCLLILLGLFIVLVGFGWKNIISSFFFHT